MTLRKTLCWVLAPISLEWVSQGKIKLNQNCRTQCTGNMLVLAEEEVRAVVPACHAVHVLSATTAFQALHPCLPPGCAKQHPRMEFFREISAEKLQRSERETQK